MQNSIFRHRCIFCMAATPAMSLQLQRPLVPKPIWSVSPAGDATADDVLCRHGFIYTHVKGAHTCRRVCVESATSWNKWLFVFVLFLLLFCSDRKNTLEHPVCVIQYIYLVLSSTYIYYAIFAVYCAVFLYLLHSKYCAFCTIYCVSQYSVWCRKETPKAAAWFPFWRENWPITVRLYP